jgi:hypothetical protein
VGEVAELLLGGLGVRNLAEVEHLDGPIRLLHRVRVRLVRGHRLSRLPVDEAATHEYIFAIWGPELGGHWALHGIGKALFPLMGPIGIQ